MSCVLMYADGSGFGKWCEKMKIPFRMEWSMLLFFLIVSLNFWIFFCFVLNHVSEEIKCAFLVLKIHNIQMQLKLLHVIHWTYKFSQEYFQWKTCPETCPETQFSTLESWYFAVPVSMLEQFWARSWIPKCHKTGPWQGVPPDFSEALTLQCTECCMPKI